MTANTAVRGQRRQDAHLTEVNSSGERVTDDKRPHFRVAENRGKVAKDIQSAPPSRERSDRLCAPRRARAYCSHGGRAPPGTILWIRQRSIIALAVLVWSGRRSRRSPGAYRSSRSRGSAWA